MAVDSVEGTSVARKRGTWLSLDWWAVLLAFVLALLVRVGVLQHVSW
jgi:glycerol-3-phosphate acyltransferase PlsY